MAGGSGSGSPTQAGVSLMLRGPLEPALPVLRPGLDCLKFGRLAKPDHAESGRPRSAQASLCFRVNFFLENPD